MANWHSFKALGEYFLFDVPSNSLFNIAESIFNYLNDLPVGQGELAQVEADLNELRTKGYLSAVPDQVPKLVRDNSLKALCLHISHDCNLRCEYCLQVPGRSAGIGKR